MIKIAICDDDNTLCSHLEKLLEELLEEYSEKYEIEIFYTGTRLCTELESQTYDIIFLDIEMPEINGIEVGKYIREQLHNETLQIAYISSLESYAMKLFEFRPINFLVKPLGKSDVKKILDKYFLITNRNYNIFTYSKNIDYYKVPLSKIMYFESSKRKIRLVATNFTDEFYGTTEEIYKKVKHHSFLFIHKSVIVNYFFIKKITYEHVELMDNTILPISRSRQKEIRSMYMQLRKEEL